MTIRGTAARLVEVFYARHQAAALLDGPDASH